MSRSSSSSRYTKNSYTGSTNPAVTLMRDREQVRGGILSGECTPTCALIRRVSRETQVIYFVDFIFRDRCGRMRG